MADLANNRPTPAQLVQQLRRWGVTGAVALDAAPLRSTGLAPLDDLLPERGLPPGALLECLTDGSGCGAGTLVFAALARALQPQEQGVVVDSRRRFFPAAVPPELLERLLVIHPAGERDLLWTLEQSLRCRGVSAVVGWVDRLSPQAYRRLKLAAEAGGGVGWLLRPAERLPQPSWADIRWRVRPGPSRSQGTAFLPVPPASDVRLSFEPPSEAEGQGEGGQASRLETVPPHPDPLPHWSSCADRRIASGGEGERSAAGTGSLVTPLPAGRRLRIELLHCRGRLGERAADLELDDDTGAVRLVPSLASATVLPGAVPHWAAGA